MKKLFLGTLLVLGVGFTGMVNAESSCEADCKVDKWKGVGSCSDYCKCKSNCSLPHPKCDQKCKCVSNCNNDSTCIKNCKNRW